MNLIQLKDYLENIKVMAALLGKPFTYTTFSTYIEIRRDSHYTSTLEWLGGLKFTIEIPIKDNREVFNKYNNIIVSKEFNVTRLSATSFHSSKFAFRFEDSEEFKKFIEVYYLDI